jgi:hypothetical protein
MLGFHIERLRRVTSIFDGQRAWWRAQPISVTPFRSFVPGACPELAEWVFAVAVFFE